MIKCPKCGERFSIGSFICPRKVSISKKDKIANLSKHLKKEDGRAERYFQVSKLIKKEFNEREISSKKIMSMFGWLDHSDGDATLTFLDALVCNGSLEKIRHKKGKGGHLYKQKEQEVCPYFKEGKCKCPIGLYKHLEEEEVDGKIGD